MACSLEQMLAGWFALSWSEAYHTPVGKAIEGVSAAQAFWRPSPQRHSIWQHVMHTAYWREVLIRVVEDPSSWPSEADLRAHSWPAHPEPAGEEAWQEARQRLLRSHERLSALLRGLPEGRLEAPGWKGARDPLSLVIGRTIGHDSYHVGQIMLLRALQGMPPVD